ncbi:MAG: hypothetical protein ACRDZP_00950 [Acidimicrobiales bacterium]
MPPESAADAGARAYAEGRGPSAEVPPSIPGPSIDSDIAGKITKKVDELVMLIRDRAIRPVASGVRYLIFGLVALAVGAVLAVLFAVFAIRVLDDEVPPFHHRVWASYLIVGGIFWLGGAFLSRKRHSRS